jgi:hypothetical protein
MLTAAAGILFPDEALGRADCLDQWQQRTGRGAERPVCGRRDVKAPLQIAISDADCRQAGIADVVEDELTQEADAQPISDVGRGRADLGDFQGDGPFDTGAAKALSTTVRFPYPGGPSTKDIPPRSASATESRRARG